MAQPEPLRLPDPFDTRRNTESGMASEPDVSREWLKMVDDCSEGLIARKEKLMRTLDMVKQLLRATKTRSTPTALGVRYSETYLREYGAVDSPPDLETSSREEASAGTAVGAQHAAIPNTHLHDYSKSPTTTETSTHVEEPSTRHETEIRKRWDLRSQSVNAHRRAAIICTRNN
ncbi:hypothetical protein CVT26_009211 [Gymnopilus dilepis]|uniref:Uncharacterized protein n=1 Tax=Gymnopilus dilepis TaxID=231916 RepID=A0A409WCN4_9AGAR|nr:hypothetical protein CVT26_009211 [Gymnopilus dilepis]